MLNKILDNYYTSKLLEEIEWCFIVIDLDYKCRKEKDRVIIEVKPKKYSNKFYFKLVTIEKNEALKYYLNLDKTKKWINDYIKLYLEKEGE